MRFALWHRAARATVLTLVGTLPILVPGPAAASLSFGPIVDVSKTPADSRMPHMAIDRAGTLHIAWSDGFKILYTRSVDRGQTFLPTVQVSTGVGAAIRPRVVTTGASDVYLVWMQDPDTAQQSDAKEVMFSRSLDGGATFGHPIDLSNSPGNSQDGRIAVNAAGVIFVVWDEGSPSRHVALARSSDRGATFEAPRTVSPIVYVSDCSPGAAQDDCTAYPGIAIDPHTGSVYLVWHDLVGGAKQVVFSRSLDGGDTFSVPRDISAVAGEGHCAAITVGPSGRILVAFEDETTGPSARSDAGFVQSTDGGQSFSPTIVLSDQSGFGTSEYPYPSEAPDGSIVIGWEGNPTGAALDAVVAVSTDGGASFGPPLDISNNPTTTSTEVVTLFAPDGTLYVAWEDYQNGQGEILLRTATGAAAPPPALPALSLDLDQTVFHPGDSLVLTATLTPGTTAPLADAYIVLQLPDGRVLSLQGAGTVSGVVPIAAGLTPGPYHGVVLRYTFTGSEPTGPYSCFSALVRAGTLTPLGAVRQIGFTVAH